MPSASEPRRPLRSDPVERARAEQELHRATRRRRILRAARAAEMRWVREMLGRRGSAA
jgi:hypothetical protein